MKLSIFRMNRPGEDAEENAAPFSSGDVGADPGVRPDLQAPLTTPRSMAETRPFAFHDLRVRVLDRLLILGSVLSILALLANLPLILQNARWGLLILYPSMVALLLFFAVRRDISYIWRAITISLAVFIVGLAILLNEGLYGSGRVFLLAAALVPALLGGRWSRNTAAAVSIATIFVVGGLMVTGWIPAPVLAPGSGNTSPVSWLSAGMSFTLLAVTLVFSLGILLQGLENSFTTQNTLMGELRRERAALEQRVQTRTLALERRLQQIRAAAEITRTISRVLDIEELLPEVCRLVQERFGLYYVGIFLVESASSETEAQGFTLPGNRYTTADSRERSSLQERSGMYAVLAAGTGEAGRLMMAEGHRLQVGGESMIGWSMANRQARIALDTGKEPTRFNNPYLPRTRSELALPIIVGEGERQEAQRQRRHGDPGSPAAAGGVDLRGALPTPIRLAAGRILGAMTIQSDQEAAFDQDDIIVLQGIADGLASAIENARLFAATQASLEEVRTLHRQYLENAWNETRRARGDLTYTYEDRASKDLPAENDAETGPGNGADSSATLLTPIILRDQVIGSLVFELPGAEWPEGAQRPQAGWTSQQKQLIEAITTQAALALENARLLEETRRTADQERASAQITSKLWSSGDLDQIVSTALTELASKLAADAGWLEIWPEGDEGPGSVKATEMREEDRGDVDG